MSVAVVFTLCAVGSLVLALALWLETRRLQRAVPRLVVTTGVVRELESVLTGRSVGGVRSSTLVQVDFSAGGKSYCCRTLHYFTGNRHVGDVGKKFDLPPGQEVGVYYDPVDPRRSALVIDQPRYDSTWIAVGVAVLFAILAAVQAF